MRRPAVRDNATASSASGIGMTIEDVLASRDGAHPRVRVLGIPTRFIPHAKPDVILSSLGLDARGIVAIAPTDS